MTDLESLRRQAEAAARTLEHASGSIAGMREGFEASGPVRLRPHADEPTARHGGYLAARLLGSIATRYPIDDHLVLTACGYAAALATPEGQRMLPGPSSLRGTGPGAPSTMKAHLFAAALVEKHQKHRLDEGVERMFFEWILGATRTLATPELVAKMEELRQRRLERTGL